MNSIFNLFTTTETSNTHLLEENRNEDTVIPKFIEVIEEFASVSNMVDDRYEGLTIVDLENGEWGDDPEVRTEILEDLFGPPVDVIIQEECEREGVEHPLVQLAIDLDAQQLPTVEDYPELDSEQRASAFKPPSDTWNLPPAALKLA